MRYGFSQSYLDEHLGLVIPDYRRNDFSSCTRIRAMKGLKLGVTPFRYREGAARRLFPDAEFVLINSPREFFRGNIKGVDAMLYTAQTATAWTLVYPSWTVIIPEGLKYISPMAFALPDNQLEWCWYINTWLDAAMKSGLGRNAYDHWILGREEKNKTRRWSVIKDVLSWTD
jgi:hypothetical protein